MILYGIGLVCTYLYMSGCGDVTSNLSRGASIGGGLGALYTHNFPGNTDYQTNKEKNDEAVIGAMVGGATGKLLADIFIGGSTILQSFVAGSSSAIGSSLMSRQGFFGKTGDDNDYEKAGYVIGSLSTIGNIFYP